MSKKDKLLTDAQKLLQKGQTDKAISCYQDALAVDPGDLRVRQRFAELLAKSRRVDDARKELEIIGRNLTANGFYLKAIAVYKQIEKLFPEDIGVALTLASLNEKHGLSANALAEYKRAYDHYELLQNHAEALKALEAMQRIDAHNPNIKLKYAEVLFQQGKLEESQDAFRSLGLLLVERRDDAAFGRLAERISQLFPDKQDFACSVIEQKINDGSAEQAAAVLQSLIKVDPKRLPAWRLLVMAYRALGNSSRLKTICQHCSKLFPSELFPREQLIRCLLEEQDSAAALTMLDESEQLFLAAGAAGVMREFYLTLNDLVPINIRILKGCARICEAAGNSEEAASYAAKIGSLAGLGGQAAAAQSVAPEPLSAEPQLDIELEPLVPGLSEEVVDESVSEAGPRELDISDFIDTSVSQDADFYEIEVELDDDLGGPAPAPADTWFETVNDIFDNIQTQTGKVRFGEGMDNGDAQSQYDLGLAFHEMGLYDEAINSLRQAAEDPERRVSCLILQGACLRDKGELQLAENALRALLASPALTVKDSCALKYELALTCTALGKSDEAWMLLGEVEQLDPAYRDVSARLHDASEGKTVGGLDFSEDELLDFELK
ncbi:Tetratricopeptide repeat-containing protein [Trichlorobacter thiogenes]|uniref:Tetratricopeptide repeat-containing protein n=1 Tax=Trichlorobacter thiogenes TaxID=115783 RepID=A0A1T4RC99_9BACT|nr:tetratricopeptide repeat protein [Trichlorobacter thiogenes]SKA13614.1 Tetratricopeptide repeat-containing protein [Trichlorobacter thiogenes]